MAYVLGFEDLSCIKSDYSVHTIMLSKQTYLKKKWKNIHWIFVLLVEMETILGLIPIHIARISLQPHCKT